jgi:hypothetical protein
LPDKRQQPARYEPLPSVLELPSWVWRRLPRVTRVLSVLSLVAVIGAGIAIAPGIQESKGEREQAEREARLKARAEHEALVRREQRPQFVTADPAADVAARRRLVEEAGDSVLGDARRRVASSDLRGPIRGVACEPFPRNVAGRGADDSTKERFGRYSCIAMTAEFTRNERSTGGLIGHPYRLRIDFDTGRYAYCKITGRPAEGQLKRRLGPTVPRACGGGP